MRIGPGFTLVLVVTTGLGAQVRTGGGSVVHPGGSTTGLPGVTRTLGSVVNPAQGGLRVPGSRPGISNNRGVVTAYPVFIGGYYPTPYISSPDDSSGGSSGQARVNVTVVMPPPQQPVTPVVINYNYGAGPVPVPVEPDRGPAGVQDDNPSEPSHYLIAFKDHTIYAATAYWVDGDTIHYFTSGNVHNQASLALVDRDFTLRLNKEAGVEVALPAPKK